MPDHGALVGQTVCACECGTVHLGFATGCPDCGTMHMAKVGIKPGASDPSRCPDRAEIQAGLDRWWEARNPSVPESGEQVTLTVEQIEYLRGAIVTVLANRGGSVKRGKALLSIDEILRAALPDTEEGERS